MKRLPTIIGLILVVVILNLYINSQQPDETPPPRQIEGLPWQIETFADGTSAVFGVHLSKDSLGEAISVLGPDYEMAIVVVPDEPPSLEIYYNSYTAALFTGKLLLVGDATTDTLQRFIDRAFKAKQLQNGTRLITLDVDDNAAALATTVKTITFVPSIPLEKDIALQRFGEPAQTIRTSQTSEHLLYPDKGLDLLIDEEGKEILQYVAPDKFDLLREPLLKYQ